MEITASISPRSCTNCCYCRVTKPEAVKPTATVTVQQATSQGCVFACKKLGGVGAWLINGIATVFFTTLERCSCIYIGTIDDNDPDDADSMPLFYSNNRLIQHHSMADEEVPLKCIKMWNIDVDERGQNHCYN